MKVSFVFRAASFLVYVVAATAGVSQDLPSIPPRIDPAFWGHANKPYALKLTITSTDINGNKAPLTRNSEHTVFRDSTGRVRTESFYDSGQPMHVMIRDPGKNVQTMMQVVGKQAWVLPLTSSRNHLVANFWKVERLPSRVIAGFPAEGFRFTSTVPASDDGKRAADTFIEDVWISNELDVILERKVQSQLTGTITETVSDLKQVEPDPTLFTVPSDYSLQKSAASVSP